MFLKVNGYHFRHSGCAILSLVPLLSRGRDQVFFLALNITSDKSGLQLFIFRATENDVSASITGLSALMYNIANNKFIE